MWFRTQNIPKAAKIDESEESATEDSVPATEVAKKCLPKTHQDSNHPFQTV